MPPDGELHFLHPLPVERLWGVGPVTSRKLHDAGIRTVGQVAGMAEEVLTDIIGRAAGRHLHALAHNRDPRRVEVGRRRRSIGSQRALGRGRRTPAELDTFLVGLIDRVSRRLRKARRVFRTVVLRLRFDDFTRATRSYTLPEASDQTDAALATARALLAEAMPMIEAKGITLIGVSLSNLDDTDEQLVFSFDRQTALDAVLDRVRERYGSGRSPAACWSGRDDPAALRHALPMLPGLSVEARTRSDRAGVIRGLVGLARRPGSRSASRPRRRPGRRAGGRSP